MGITVNKDTKITVALLPKHPTRKATDRILRKENKYMDLVTIKDYQQLVALTGTCHVAIVGTDKKFYKITPQNAEKQFELAVKGEALTADKVDTFGIAKIDNFITDPISGGSTDETALKERKIGTIQHDVKIYNGIITGTLEYVSGYEKFDEHNKARQSGYYVVIHYDKTGAEASTTGKFSNVKYTIIGDSVQNKLELADKDNVLYLGATKEEALSRKIVITGKIKIDAKDVDVELYLKPRFKYLSNVPSIRSNLQDTVEASAPHHAPTPPRRAQSPQPPSPPQGSESSAQQGGSQRRRGGGGSESSEEAHS